MLALPITFALKPSEFIFPLAACEADAMLTIASAAAPFDLLFQRAHNRAIGVGISTQERV